MYGFNSCSFSAKGGCGRVMCNFQCRVVLLIWILIEQGFTVLAISTGGVVRFMFLSHITALFFFPVSEIDE